MTTFKKLPGLAVKPAREAFATRQSKLLPAVQKAPADAPGKREPPEPLVI
jgi:hypothetical protein